MGFGVEGLGSRVWGLGFRVQGLSESRGLGLRMNLGMAQMMSSFSGFWVLGFVRSRLIYGRPEGPPDLSLSCCMFRGFAVSETKP